MPINWDRYETYDTSNGFGNAKKWRSSFNEKMGAGEAENIINSQGDLPHQILGVNKNASQAEIKKAFRELINFWHPDKNKAPNAEAMSKKIIAAYTILKK